MIKICRMDQDGYHSQIIVVADGVQDIRIPVYKGKKPCAQVISSGLFGPETMQELSVALKLAARLSTGEVEIYWGPGN